MTSYVQCPHCRVRYPLEKLYSNAHDRPAQGKSYTIVCAVCRRQFDVSFQRRWPLPLRAVVKG
jgi:hypothetical protein